MEWWMLGLSMAANLCFLISEVIRKYRPKPKEKPQLTQDASELMGQLLRGGAITVVQVVDPDSIFQWSPKR